LLKVVPLITLTKNAFAKRLGEGFDISKMLVVDMMHEFELGVWKALFTHLLRVLYAASGPSGTLIDAANERYLLYFLLATHGLTSSRFRQLPTFGLSTIRNFRDNVSEMKRLAARDYEDLLQV
jgi:hypothetical protein